MMRAIWKTLLRALLRKNSQFSYETLLPSICQSVLIRTVFWPLLSTSLFTAVVVTATSGNRLLENAYYRILGHEGLQCYFFFLSIALSSVFHSALSTILIIVLSSSVLSIIIRISLSITLGICLSIAHDIVHCYGCHTYKRFGYLKMRATESLDMKATNVKFSSAKQCSQYCFS